MCKNTVWFIVADWLIIINIYVLVVFWLLFIARYELVVEIILQKFLFVFFEILRVILDDLLDY